MWQENQVINSLMMYNKKTWIYNEWRVFFY